MDREREEIMGEQEKERAEDKESGSEALRNI